MLTRRADLSPNQLRVIEAIDAKHGGTTSETSLPDLTPAEADAMIVAIRNAVPLTLDQIKNL